MRAISSRRLEPVLGEIETDVFADSQGIEQRAGLKDHGQPVILRHLRDPGWICRQ